MWRGIVSIQFFDCKADLRPLQTPVFSFTSCTYPCHRRSFLCTHRPPPPPPPPSHLFLVMQEWEKHRHGCQPSQRKHPRLSRVYLSSKIFDALAPTYVDSPFPFYFPALIAHGPLLLSARVFSLWHLLIFLERSFDSALTQFSRRRSNR